MSSFLNIYYTVLFCFIGIIYLYKASRILNIEVSRENMKKRRIPSYAVGRKDFLPLCRPPIISGSMSYYHRSFLVSAKTNKQINRLNMRIEIILAFLILISSLLVLSVEKFWWGGLLSWSDPSETENMAYSDMMLSIYHIKSELKKTDIYV